MDGSHITSLYNITFDVKILNSDGHIKITAYDVRCFIKHLTFKL